VITRRAIFRGEAIARNISSGGSAPEIKASELRNEAELRAIIKSPAPRINEDTKAIIRAEPRNAKKFLL
jgi:hypothetical protein